MNDDVEVIPTCDICGEHEDQDPTNGPEYNWNGETGNHLSCEGDSKVNDEKVLVVTFGDGTYVELDSAPFVALVSRAYLDEHTDEDFPVDCEQFQHVHIKILVDPLSLLV